MYYVLVENNEFRGVLDYKPNIGKDWLVLRHQDQLALGIETSLTEEEYLELLKKRQEARTAVVDYKS